MTVLYRHRLESNRQYLQDWHFTLFSTKAQLYISSTSFQHLLSFNFYAPIIVALVSLQPHKLSVRQISLRDCRKLNKMALEGLQLDMIHTKFR